MFTASLLRVPANLSSPRRTVGLLGRTGGRLLLAVGLAAAALPSTPRPSHAAEPSALVVLPVSADQAEFDGTWSYVSAICGQSLSSEQLVAALSTPAGPIRGELQISSQAQQFTAMERDGGLCGVAVPPQIEPTRRCEADVFTSTGRFRLKPETGLQRAGPGRAGQSGLASFESWVPVSQTADQGRQGLGTSRIEHVFELFDVQVGSTRHRLLKIVTMPGEIFTDACIDAGLGRFTLYLLKKPSV